ncbi:hypothetical protein GCM10007938_25140 [Vibrio zhanjiangensis]|uniref:Uncharacterized protein n=1 Tax=Vibrio zhanjiangensis TaxID=1046128 RepID=A0ABQ6EZT3_9VIBR|nr:hypothetical protein [Vibrio zhanjiangensis]GLT18733.1 hypothetical protein GCM10007938_25140 [Vibrio zhanjiangensis]
MQYETDPKGLSWPIKPALIIDNVATGNVSVSLSPEIPVSSFSLKQCFDNTSLNSDIRKQWASVLRDIASELDE